uniref:DNA 5'-3' helicase n=1 Tax=viral metagenome TaxID=1070528 RepID=A0A6M3LGP3_9ZZZZ
MSDMVRRHGAEAERNILGCVLLNGRNAWLSIADTLTAADFSTPEHRDIVDAILTLDVEGEPIDVETVTTQGERNGHQMRKLYLLELVAGSGCVPSDLPMQVKLLQEAASQRRIEQAHNAMGAAIGGDGTPAEIVEQYTRTLLDLNNTMRRRDKVDFAIADVVPEALGDYREMESMRATGKLYAGLDCGFPDINDKLNGLREEEETVLAGRPSIGKTVLGLQFGLSVARASRKHVGVWTCEMSRRQVVGRMIQLISRVDAEDMRKGRLSTDDKRALHEAAEELAELPITIFETPGLTVPQFAAQAERMRMRHDVGLMLIDHLHRMDGPGNSLYERYTRISTGLRDYSLPTGTPHLLVLAQLNRLSEGRLDKTPQMSELRDAGGIEQDAVNVMLINRPGHYKECRKAAKAKGEDTLSRLISFAELSFEKTRFGPTGEVELHWDTATASFQSAMPSYLTKGKGSW